MNATLEMTLRDFFAAMALAGIIQAGAEHKEHGEVLLLQQDVSAAFAFKYADAMLAERDRSK